MLTAFTALCYHCHAVGHKLDRLQLILPYADELPDSPRQHRLTAYVQTTEACLLLFPTRFSLLVLEISS